jgi:molybdopterin-guanine dinucleotide biosynthesis protein A
MGTGKAARPSITVITACRRETVKMKKRKKNLHVLLDQEVYEKLRHITFYERNTISDVVRRLIVEYLEEKALAEPDFVAPHRL